LTKNLWRTTNNCLASANKEAEGEHKPETYTFSVKPGESGKQELCLNLGEGESGAGGCFARKEK
jgi:hypothetical protein